MRSSPELATTPQRDAIERAARKAGFDDGSDAIAAFDSTYGAYGHKLTKNEASMVLDALADGRLVPPPPTEPEPVVTAPSGGIPADAAVALLGQTVTIVGVSGKEFTYEISQIGLKEPGRPALIGYDASGQRTTVALDRVASWQVQ